VYPFCPGFRVYFGLVGDEIVLLLCGGDKRSQGRDIAARFVIGRSINPVISLPRFVIGRSINPVLTKSYDAFLLEELRDPELAAEYLSTAAEEGSAEQLVIALRTVAEANGGLGAVTERTQLNHQAMYKALSNEGNPTLTTLLAILRAVNLNLTFTPLHRPMTS
jgi:probable addiction module antidote protein